MINAGNNQVGWYFADGYIYMDVPGIGWSKSKFHNTGGVLEESPAFAIAIAHYAENMRLVSDNGSDFVIVFDLSPEFFKESAKSESRQVREDASKYARMSTVLTIAKDTMLVRAAKQTYSFNSPTEGSFSVDENDVYSDYNVPMTFALPAEAAGARNVSSSAPSDSASLPGMPAMIPGLSGLRL